ncbi:hypothetical protein HQ571_04155 [Candidatus Kuenenbacteria bacterium]|nr:hypothetical protein [Candidatus Kuenenbacteria bacterium]
MTEYIPKYTRDWKKWGKQPSNAMKHQDDWEECPICRFRRSSHFYPYIVGYRSLKRYHASVGELVIECPKCFGFFTSHVHETDIFLAEVAHENPEFFEIPEAREALLRMLKKE